MWQFVCQRGAERSISTLWKSDFASVSRLWTRVCARMCVRACVCARVCVCVLTREKAWAPLARRCTAILWRHWMMREQALASLWAIHSTRSSASIRLLEMLTITSPNWGGNSIRELQMFPITLTS